MIAALHEIKIIATELQAESSKHDPRQKKITRIINIIDEVDDG